jgi:hypothetical protein
MTRLAASPADLWEGILSTNADYVAEAAAAMAAVLPAKTLGTSQWIEETFQRAGDWRARLAQARSTERR